MNAPSICFHIGAMKSGTTYVQKMLSENASNLSAAGVFYPQPWVDQSAAVRDVLGLAKGQSTGPVDGSWRRLVGRLQSSDRPRAIVSHEFFSFATAEQVRGIIHDLMPSDVSVVLGVRDLGRGLPAQWQTMVRGGKTDTYREYTQDVTQARVHRNKSHFWKRQDFGQIATNWAEHVGRENVTVVTVPPKGSPTTELWRRMAFAMDLDEVALVEASASNESMGSTGIELIRRINVEAKIQAMTRWAHQHAVNQALSHDVLPKVNDPNPALRIPNDCHQWAVTETDRLISEIKESGVRVVGDLDDLRPALDKTAPFVWPEEIPDEDMLSVAVEALTQFANSFAKEKRRRLAQRGKGDDRRKRGGTTSADL